jgi:carboxyl-terminal processing protease
MTFRRKTVALLIVASMAFGSIVTALFSNNKNIDSITNTLNTQSSKSKEFQTYEAKLKKTYDMIRANYVRPVSDKALLDGSIRGMVQALGDPHSEYMDQKEAEQFLSIIMNSSFSGIGAVVVLKNGQVTIDSIVKGSPAEKARLQVNDQIRKANGKSLAGLTLNEAVTKIRGPKGSKVVLEVVRGESAPFTITAVRQDIPQKTVDNTMLANQIGYVNISQFSQTTDKEFATSLTQLEKKNMQGLIIDLRGNSGGLLSVVVHMCEELLLKGKTIVMTQGKTEVNGHNTELYVENQDGYVLPYTVGNKTIYRAKASKIKPYPITILVDGASASAAEIMAAALQQSGGYKVIGKKTYGKGTVQSSVEFSDGSNLKLTIAKWLTPNGTWIDKHGGTKGLTPNIVVEPLSFTQASLPNTTKTLKQNSNGADVKNIQIILDALGLEPGRTDGYFDAKTVAAVKTFQNINRIPMNGALDSLTAKYLSVAFQNLLKDPKNDEQLQAAIQFLD